MREPLTIPVAALAAGILTGHFFFFEERDLSLAACVCAFALLFAFCLESGRRLRLSAACSALVIAGIGTQVIHRQGPAPRLNAADGETVLLSGCVINPPVFSPDREQFTVELKPGASARISAHPKNGEHLALSYGDRVELPAKVRSPRNFQNPDAFDYAAYLANQHIYWTATATDLSALKTSPGACGSRLATLLFGVRGWALRRLTDLYPDDSHTAALLQATLLGETTGVERRWTNDFRVTGTYHALVISGQHVSVLAFTLLFILRIFQIRRVPALGVATIASWAYAFISGMSSPVVRAAGGFTLFLIASYCFRKTRILNVLAAVALLYLLFDPDQLFDPSFQLSFLSAAAIAVFAIPLMDRWTNPLRQAIKNFDQVTYDPQVEVQAAGLRVELRLVAETLRVWTGLPVTRARAVVAKSTAVAIFMLEAVIVSACVQFGLALPMISYFHRLSITGLSANIVVVPLLSVVVPLGFASIVTGWHVLAVATAVFLHWAEAIASWHVRFEPSWRIAAIPLAVALAFGVSSGILAITIRIRSRFAPVALAVSLALFGAILWQPWRPHLKPKYLELTAIDVSQGDSLFLAFPNGQTLLVDAGGFPGMERMKRKPQIDMGEDVVSPYLWSRGINHLDFVALSHGHSDHMAGLPAVLDNFHPRALWIGAEPETSEWQEVKRHALADGVQIIPLTRASASMTIGGTMIRVLAPSPDYVPADAPGNNDSLVMEISYGRRSMLLTGDAERPVEDEMVASGVLRPVTLLKVGHHGSKTSSSEEFLQAIAPRYAVISDGFMNQFHHPHPSVLERFAEHNVKVFRTDERGATTFRTDGDRIEFETYR